MRFASIGSANAGSYASAGAQVANSAAKIFDVQRKTGPDYAGLSKVAMNTQSNEKVTAMRTAAHVTKEGINQLKNKTITQHKLDVFKFGQDQKAKQRKAGGIAAIGKIGAAAVLSRDNTKGRERPKSDIGSFYEKWKTQRDELTKRHDSEMDSLGDFKSDPFKSSDSSTGTGGTAGKVTEGGSTSLGSGNTGVGANFDMTKLTDKDYDDLAYAISSEAQLGTDDEYGVAANILTRLKSGKYGNSVHSIIHAPGQYEGVYKGFSRNSPNIAARLKSQEGQSRILEFMNTLNGRTEFKGQSMLHNRVSSEDPMFSPGGNFYHYAGQ